MKKCVLIVVGVSLDEAMYAEFNDTRTRFPFRRRVQSNNTTELERVIAA